MDTKKMLFASLLMFAFSPMTQASPCEVETVEGKKYSGDCSQENNSIIIRTSNGIEHTIPKNKIKPKSNDCMSSDCTIETHSGETYSGKCQELEGGQVKISMIDGSIVQIPDKMVKNRICPPVSEQSSKFDLRFEGSNTLGAHLVPNFLRSYYERQGFNTEIITDPASHDDKILKVTHSAKPSLQISVKSPGSSKAFTALMEGKADIGMSSRPIDDNENSRLQDLRRPETEHVVGLDALAIITNGNLHLNSATKREIADYFSGLSGNYRIYSRDNNSGTYKTFEEMVLKPFGLSLSSSSERFSSNGTLAEKVSREPNGIGFTPLATATGGINAKTLNINECGLMYNPKDVFYIKSEEYPLSRRLFLYNLNVNSNINLINQFTNYAISSDGQAVVTRTGFIDLEISVQSDESKTQRLLELFSNYSNNMQHHLIRNDYLNITRNAKRLSVTFRFRFNSSNLDSRAFRDIERLNSFLSKEEYKNSEIILLGFADTVGGVDSQGNINLALRRANAIKDKLNVRSAAAISAKSFAGLIPVACNENDEGKAKNRRVEVWIR